MKLLKDLLYTRGNEALDISRFFALLSVLCYWCALFLSVARGGPFDAIEAGTGIGALFAGAAGWIHMRQKHEDQTGRGAAP